ncbi:MAG TPA: DNA primase [Acidimicrobiia bacterium]
MGIVDEDIARVREATDLVALAGEHLALKRVGSRYTGLCPFHAEKTASFSINPEAGLYYCFGCGARGDAITFVREVEHLDFVDAVERLARLANIELHYDEANVSKDRQRRSRLAEVVSAAVAYYHDLLLTSPDAKRARGYLRSRGFEGDAARRFLLGWAPDGFDALSRHLQQQRFARDDIVQAGLAFVNRTNKLQDQFRGRLMFPIFDVRGDAVGFGGRTLGTDPRKYMNSPETPLYHKSRLLYGLNWAKGEIVARGDVIICEGYTDVMAFALAGSPNAVATCGTALADEHFGVLKNFARRITLAYDADAAGRSAAERWYQWEQRFDIEVRVAGLPRGRDPADLWHDDPGALQDALEHAKPFVQFRVDRALEQADLSTVEGRARAAEAVVPVLAEHPSELVREGYIGHVAGTLGVPHTWFKDALARHASGARPPRREAPSRRAELDVAGLDVRELEALRIAVHAPELVAETLDAALFTAPATRDAFDALLANATLHDAIESAGPDARGLLERLAVEEPSLGDEPQDYATEVVANLVAVAAQRTLHELVEHGDDRSSTLKHVLDQLVSERERRDWVAARPHVEELLPWVVGRSQAGVP